MEYRRLGKSGLKVCEFSFGAWVTFGKQVGEDDAASIMSYAYDNGINFFDNAEGYEQGNAEVVMGEALKALKLVARQLCGVLEGVLGRRQADAEGPQPQACDGSGACGAEASAGSTISTSISATGPTSTRRSKRRCGRCTIS